ncbi:hypothetical protein PtrV1_09440 [Pyrenophora tritici-repentis]|uniref:Uncharacterized protein n=1 Tax=Pyrenophora tritici-repentis TaxID=45151 RepID=A0A5M9L370_9PLEO|nr:hypothetical protein PtrV1_09440 [Pyrenophora tritici-repentis]KAF7443107.1 hypothetical protein A1F99_126140 [Pyrenophora tritici-repentis]KAI0609737.1 hypothetical protein TUN205_06025 [Pyrenophora tritici-repentis]KAI1511538.1 hypothetical protein Ptr86124_009182 [Pyrenophora tritici-repentis]
MRNKRRRPVSRVDPYIAYRRSKDLSAKFERVLSAIHRSALVSDNDDEWKVASELSEEFQSVLRDWQDTSTIDRILDLPFLAYTLDTQGATSYDKLLISGVEDICSSLGFSIFFSTIKRDRRMECFLGPVQDTHYQPLSEILIPTPYHSLARSDLVDCYGWHCRRAHEEMFFTVLLLVPDLHAFLQCLLLTSTQSVLNYYRTKSEREAGCKEYGMIMFDQICTKVFEHREGLDTGDGRSKEYSLETMLIPVIVQCAELNKIEMFHRGIRGLKGATIDAYSRLLYLVPDISFSKIVEGLEIAVESLKAIEERYKGLRKLFRR